MGVTTDPDGGTPADLAVGDSGDSKPAKGVTTDPDGGTPADLAVDDSGDSKPANEVTTDSGAGNRVLDGLTIAPVPRSLSSAEPYREIIEPARMRGRNAMAIWQDLVSDHGFGGSYEAVKRFVRKLGGVTGPAAAGIIQTGPGEDYVERRVMVSHTEEAVESFDCSPGVAKRVST